MVRTAAEIRFERGEQKRAALEQFLRQGLALEDALATVDMKRGNYQQYRSKYPHWGARWTAARLHGRDLSRGEIVISDPEVNDHVPPTFDRFIDKYFPDRDPPMVQHLLLADALQTVRPREVVLFLLWPGAGKSSVIEDYICRKLALDPDHRFRVVSSNQDHAGRMLDFCKRRFTDIDVYPGFISRFGPFYETNQERSGKPWSAREITVWKSTGTERDRSLKASGWESATLGSRIDTLIWDDVQTPENFGEAEKIFYRLRSTYFSRGKSMRTIIVGNRCGPMDLYERMIDAGLITRQVIVPATGTCGAPAGEPSVPAWWADTELVHDGGPCCGGMQPFRRCPRNGALLTPQEFVDLTKHSVGDDAWFSLYEQNPVHNSLSTFGEALDQCLDESRKIGVLHAV